MANMSELVVRELERHVRLAERLKGQGMAEDEPALARAFARCVCVQYLHCAMGANNHHKARP